MDINNVIAELKTRGHQFGTAAISPEGLIMLNIDGRLMSCDSARELLLKEREAGNDSFGTVTFRV